MALLFSLAISTSAQAATIRGTFEHWGYISVANNNAWCSGTDAGIVMRCALQNWVGSESIVNSCVETSRYIVPGSLGVGGSTFGGYVYGTCNVHTISPPQDRIIQVSPGLSIWVALNNILVCPNSTWTGDGGYQCSCNAGYKVDAAGTSCVPVAPPVTCPVTALSSFPPANDACSQALENRNSTQAQKNAACGTLTTAMQTGQTCLAGKLAAMSPVIPFVRTADIRSVAYQAHLREIWDKMQDVVATMNKEPAMRTACAAHLA